MNSSTWAVGIALLTGTLRGVQLWRASTPVEVINSAILTALGEGKGSGLPTLLKTGSALYLEIAQRICEPVEKLLDGTDAELREQLNRDAQRALLGALRRLGRSGWLDHVTLGALLFAGVSAMTGPAPSAMLALELVAATLLWLSNLYGARSLGTRCFAGAMALVDGLVEGRKHFRLEPSTQASVAAP